MVNNIIKGVINPEEWNNYAKESYSDEVITYDSPEAAQYVTVSGWIDRQGYFRGDDEHLARYSGCTHRACTACGALIRKDRTLCVPCGESIAKAAYKQANVAMWDQNSPIYSEKLDQYFNYLEDICFYLEDHTDTIEDLRLYLCEPIYIRELDTDYWYDDLPDEKETPYYLQLAVDNFNAEIEENLKEPLSYYPGKVAVDLTDHRIIQMLQETFR